MRVENIKGAVWTVNEAEFCKRRPQKLGIMQFKFQNSSGMPQQMQPGGGGGKKKQLTLGGVVGPPQATPPLASAVVASAAAASALALKHPPPPVGFYYKRFVVGGATCCRKGNVCFDFFLRFFSTFELVCLSLCVACFDYSTRLKVRHFWYIFKVFDYF